MILNIQLLRFLAALSVLLYHARPPVVYQQFYTAIPILHDYARFGFAGVDVFFVISGAIMAETTRRLTPGPGTSWHFISKRFARVYAGWWPAFIIALGVHEAFRFFPLHDKDMLSSFFLIPTVPTHYFLPLIWTLVYELYFYVIIGLLLAFSRQVQLRALFVLMLVIATVNVALIQHGFYLPHRAPGYPFLLKFMLSPFILEFLAGFMVCEYVRRNPQQPWQLWLFVATCFIAGAVCYQYYGHPAGPGLGGLYSYPERVMMFGIPGCCFVAMALTLPDPTRPFLRRLSHLGDASYSLYLTHLFALTGCYMLISKLPVITQVLGEQIPLLIAICSAIVYSLVHYRYIERPLYKLFLRMLDRVNRFFGRFTSRGAAQA